MNERRSLVVILSALDVEYRAVRERLVTVHRLDSVAGTLFETGTLYAGGEVVLALTGKGNHPSAVIAERAIRRFSPIAVLFAGVAGALKPDLILGDIVAATHVYAYHGAAARDAGPKSRPRVWELDHRVQQAAHHLARRFGRVRFGPVASGEVLHDATDSPHRRWIGEHYDDALAIEMEAAGAAQAGQLSGTPVGVIRAISDRADGTKSQTAAKGAGGTQHGDRRSQAEAARNAAGFAAALAADLIAVPAGTRADAGEGPDIHVEVHGGRHGAVAGVINGDVHNQGRPS
ncbi:5'-methylthioadenosine/S-adenosylhomocysteine nucleosidase [Actinoplanes sp. TBRC 11911]|uniref:5'-methylthioadenosine/S-adenosylhomocysteine nucleosidase family protein n=1 Tax=Actinoplanes sp. TBRC 11911 TaxID=2729386 RepID=UPI00145CF083|nr:5'-methylthioadenosine/S-adenosylhomocysteine nucleosidase [Actinoplanes sp. TBRC 11911]NMO53309.1 5'-methylthioadenosine/S-adenosylhomocysteine nucleosidase [Actinoplanes sp. TBRC 11911]